MSERDYLEPWTASNGYVDDRKGDTVVYGSNGTSEQDAERIAACVSALAGVESPEVWVAAMKWVAKEIREYVTLDQLGVEMSAHSLIYKLSVASSLLTDNEQQVPMSHFAELSK